MYGRTETFEILVQLKLRIEITICSLKKDVWDFFVNFIYLKLILMSNTIHFAYKPFGLEKGGLLMKRFKVSKRVPALLNIF